MDPYSQVNDDDFELRREYCEMCAGGRPICPDPCEDVAVVVNQLLEEE